MRWGILVILVSCLFSLLFRGLISVDDILRSAVNKIELDPGLGPGFKSDLHQFPTLSFGGLTWLDRKPINAVPRKHVFTLTCTISSPFEDAISRTRAMNRWKFPQCTAFASRIIGAGPKEAAKWGSKNPTSSGCQFWWLAVTNRVCVSGKPCGPGGPWGNSVYLGVGK